MLYPFRAAKVLKLLIFVVLVTADISWRDIVDWATESMQLSTTQTALVLTAGIAVETETMVNVWNRCYDYRGNVFPRGECYRAVRIAVIRWTVELAALGKVTNWYKRDNLSESLTEISFGDLSAVVIDINSNTESSKLVKRDDGSVQFEYNNDKYTYSPLMSDDIYDGSSDLLLLGAESNASVPVTMLEANSNGTWVLSPLVFSGMNKRDGLDGNEYINGAGSMIIECQYGAGEQVTYSQVAAWVDAMDRDQNTNTGMAATYNLYHGYIGSNSRLKCATKLYSTNTIATEWRSWNDVWSSF